MKIQSTEITQILLKAKDASSAISKLYKYYKDKDPKHSLSFFCLQSGIQSKGYLSEVIQGKKKMNPLYSEGLSKAFKLKGAQVAFLKNMIDFDFTKNEEKKNALTKKRQALLKNLKIVEKKMTSVKVDSFFVLEVYGSLGLFKNKASLSDLQKQFGTGSIQKLHEALHILQHQGLVKLEGNHFVPSYDEVVFTGESNEQKNFNFLKSCLEKTQQGISTYYQNREEAYFESSIISVDKKSYTKALSKIREVCTEFQSSIESSDADQLILFGIQVFPLAEKGV